MLILPLKFVFHEGSIICILSILENDKLNLLGMQKIWQTGIERF